MSSAESDKSEPQFHKQPRGVRPLQGGISVAAIALLAGHLIWPDLEIDAVTIGLLVLAVIPWLGPLFKSIQLPGGWRFEFREFREEVRQELERSGERVTELGDRLDNIEVQITGAATPEQAQRLKLAMNDFHVYLTELGLKPPDEVPAVHVTDSSFRTAHYDPAQNLMVIGALLVNDTDVAMKAYSHHVLFSGSPRPELRAIESGLSDYLVCSFNDNPHLAASSAHVLGMSTPYLRNLDNELKLTDLAPPTDPSGTLVKCGVARCGESGSSTAPV